MGPIDEFEEKLETALTYAGSKGIPGNFSAIVSTFVRKLEEHGVRVVLAAVGAPMGGHPQVEVTADTDDVTSTVVAQVVDPILTHAGVPPAMVAGFAGMAGTATVKFLERYRQYQQQKAAAGAAGPQRPFKPKWNPAARPRRKAP